MMIHSAIWSEQGVAFFNTNPGKKGSLIHISFSIELVYVCSNYKKEQIFYFCRPIALLTLEYSLFINIQLLLHIQSITSLFNP